MKTFKVLFFRFSDSLFGKNLELEHMIFICIAMCGIIMSTIGIIGNYSLGLDPLTLLIPFLNIVVDILCLIYSSLRKRWRGPVVVVVFFAVFAMFPFLWFTTGGAAGSTMPFIVTCSLVLIIILKGKTRFIFLTVTLLMICVFIYLEMIYPDICIEYPDRESRYLDLIIGFILSFGINSALSIIVLSHYKKAKIDGEELVKQLEKISLTDPLTGVFNRRYLTACIDEEMRDAYDNGGELTICILDIDFFKNVNDTYGHVYGDEVLVKLSQIILGCLTGDEVFGRYGGEEFLIIFKGKNLNAALKIMEPLLETVRAVRWKDNKTITISGGMSVYTKGIPYSNFIENADKNLYKAKNSGRNQIAY